MPEVGGLVIRPRRCGTSPPASAAPRAYAGSPTFECSITFEDANPRQSVRGPDVDHPRRGDPPRQRRDRKTRQRRRDHGSDAAADEDLAPFDAGLVERAHGDRAHPAGRCQCRQPQALAAPPSQPRRGEPAEFILGQFLAAAPAGFLPHDHRIEFAGIVGVEQIARKADGDGERQLRRHRVQPLEQGHQFRTRGMIADAERQLLPRRRARPTSARSCASINARALSRNARTVGGQPDRARRAFDQPLADHGFQPLQLHADRSLRGAERLGGAGEALQFGHQQEGLHRGDVERRSSSNIVIIDISIDKIPK